MSLPKWISCLCVGTVPNCWNCKAAEALSVAWEALEQTANDQEFAAVRKVWYVENVKRAMCHIEEMGK